jgi:glycosyltransferase involved in cell wall biosynthesis
VVVSKAMKQMVVDEWDVTPSKISVLPNGYFQSRIAPYAGLEPTDGRVAFLGTLHPKLDVEVFREIAALPEVRELVVIGDGNKRQELEDASDRLEALRVTGRLPDEEAFRLVGKSALAINPQHHSGVQASSSPVKLAYYAALGLPAVVTSGPDLADELEMAGCLETIEPGGDFVESVRNILRSPQRRKQMAEQATVAANKLTWDQRVSQLVAEYETIFADPQFGGE